MYPVSNAFNAAIVKSHQIATSCQVLVGRVASTTLEILDGNVRMDKQADIRRHCDITVASVDLVPSTPSSLLSMYGNELYLQRGIKYSDTSSELVPLGVFRITDVEVLDSGAELIMHVQGYDRSRQIARAKFTQEYVLDPSEEYAHAIYRMFDSRVPGFTWHVTDTSPTVYAPKVSFATGDDPWKAGVKLAKDIGYQVYFDGIGEGWIAPEPDPLIVDPVWNFQEGDLSTILSLNRRQTDDGIYSHWVVTGENSNTSPPVRAEAVDDEPSSPTYYLGKFGDVPEFYSSEFITTTTQAQNAANARRANKRGAGESLQMQNIVHPAFVEGDVFVVSRPRAQLSNTKFVLDSLTIPMIAARGMDLEPRRLLV